VIVSDGRQAYTFDNLGSLGSLRSSRNHAGENNESSGGGSEELGNESQTRSTVLHVKLCTFIVRLLGSFLKSSEVVRMKATC
jgi:hypothetical protein